MREAKFYKTAEDGTVLCFLCPHNCGISNGKTGICRVRKNVNGKLYAQNYGKIASISLDPIEKKPLYHFKPNQKILSIGSYGCNFQCGFCQNHEISMGTPEVRSLTPEELAKISLDLADKGNIGVAYTYNEPFISGEFLLDCAQRIKAQGQNNVVVTNGYVSRNALEEMFPYIDAMNIDLKSFNPVFYKKIGGEIENVKATISLAEKHCHVEITTLVVPGENDSEEEMEQIARWLGEINQDIPLHISRFFPRFHYQEQRETPVETVYRLVKVAKEYLNYVYSGNC